MLREKLRTVLARYIGDPDALEGAFADPTQDLVQLGLDSMGVFALLDDLADMGITVEFPDFIADPTVGMLLRSAETPSDGF